MLPLLPCLKDENPRNNEIERMAKPFTGVEMANIILKRTPQKMQELYYAQCEFPTKVKPLSEKLEALEPIVRDFASRKKEAQVNKTASPNANPSTKNHKRTGNNQPNLDGPKRQRTAKFCQRCHDHGGAERTHNTNECAKFDKAGNLLSTFHSRKPGTGKWTPKTSPVQKGAHNYAMLAAQVENLTKQLSNDKKHNSHHRSHKRPRRYSSSGDSASYQS